MMWMDSTQVGCGLAQCPDKNATISVILKCKYNPPVKLEIDNSIKYNARRLLHPTPTNESCKTLGPTKLIKKIS